jgi:hypothetical protein
MAFGLCNHHGMKPETHIGRYIGKMQADAVHWFFDWRYRKWNGRNGRESFGQTNTKDNRAV